MQTATITTQPAIEPEAVTEAKAFMRVDATDDDDLIADLIISARGLAEEYTRRKFITTGVTLTMDRFPYGSRADWWDGVREAHVNVLDGRGDSIVLPFPPSLTIATFTTYGTDNTGSVFDSANYSLDAVGGRIYLNQGATWPINLRAHNAIAIAYTCGYGATVASVPTAIRHAIKLTVAAMYDNRECFEMPATAKAALQPYRILEERSNGV